MTTKLSDKKCIPCQGDFPPLKGDAVHQLLKELGAGWDMIVEHHLQKSFIFKNFQEALDYTNAVGLIAEQEGHHPEIILTWGKVTLRIWTHKIDGLTESDFIFAAKAEQAFAPNLNKPNEKGKSHD